MNDLASQQQALLDALFMWPQQGASLQLAVRATGVGAHPARGLKVYQSNGHMLAERALRLTYPVLVQMLGEQSFADLARALWHAHPPRRGDIAHWGDAMEDYVRSSKQLQEEPYLADVAHAEWALHGCASAPDRTGDLSTLVLLTTDEPHTLSLDLAPGLAMVSSAWPLVSLLTAHLEGIPSFAQVGAQLTQHTAQDLVIWRCGYQPRLREALTGELSMLHALQSEMSLEAALQAATDIDFSQWLPLAVKTGLVLGASRKPAVDGSTR